MLLSRRSTKSCATCELLPSVETVSVTVSLAATWYCFASRASAALRCVSLAKIKSIRLPETSFFSSLAVPLATILPWCKTAILSAS